MSDGASFVKRSKPRSSAARISSTYSDDEESPAGPSGSSSSLLTARSKSLKSNEAAVSKSSTPRKTLSTLDVDDEGEPEVSDVVFRPRVKGAKATTSSSSTPISKTRLDRIAATPPTQRTAISAMDEDEDADAADAFEIRRSNLSISGKQARRTAATGLSSSSSGLTSTPNRSKPLRPTSFQDLSSEASAPAAGVADPSTAGTSANMYTSKHLEELRSATPTLRSRAQTPSVAVGSGTRIEDPMVSQTSCIALEDLNDEDGDSLARTKFPADFSHDGIPSESFIRAAKEKRARTAAAAATNSPEDYISLGAPSSMLKAYNRMEVDDGPHPHSRLQREEDELGDGEEEFAEYTGATERIPIGEKAEKEWKEKQRREMEAAVRGSFDDEDMMVVQDDEEMDEEEQAWERAQMQRTQAVSHPQSQSREASPFRPAAIPATTPLPSVTTCSTRLQLTLRALEQSTAASGAVLNSTSSELERLEEAERENKLDVVAVEDKASWFNELNEFIASLARFMAEKVGRVEEVEKESTEILVQRRRLLAKRRAEWFKSRLGVDSLTGIIAGIEEEDGDQEMGMINDSGDFEQTDSAAQLDRLPPADELSFTLAQRDIVSKLMSTFVDVQAIEYLDPSATASYSSSASSPFPFLDTDTARHHEEDTELHPRSVVSRFSEWRRRYPDEYAQVWGGLSIAQIWEFYARIEMVLWDPFSSSSLSSAAAGGAASSTRWKKGAEAIAHMRWFTCASDYASSIMPTHQRQQEQIKDAQLEVETGGGGGDDEIISTLVSNVLIPKLQTLAQEGGAFDPWCSDSNRETVEAIDLIQTISGSGAHQSVGCYQLVERCLHSFQVLVDSLVDVVPAITGRRGEDDAEVVLVEMLEGLLGNLLMWNKVFPSTPASASASGSGSGSDNSTSTMRSAVERTYVRLVERLVMDVLQPSMTTIMRLPTKTSMEEGEERRQKWMKTIPLRIISLSERLSSSLSSRPPII